MLLSVSRSTIVPLNNHFICAVSCTVATVVGAAANSRRLQLCTSDSISSRRLDFIEFAITRADFATRKLLAQQANKEVGDPRNTNNSIHLYCYFGTLSDEVNIVHCTVHTARCTSLTCYLICRQHKLFHSSTNTLCVLGMNAIRFSSI